MQYMGGKYRIARHVEALILAMRGDRSVYVEPFLGGAATFSRIAPHFPEAWGSDVVPDLILMWEAAVAGWVPPAELSEDEWRELKTAPPSPLRGFAGFGCSFGGRWFEGYARRRTAGGREAAAADQAPAASSRVVTRQAQAMRHAQFRVSDYRRLIARPDMVIYADPPYASTKPYSGLPSWDSGEFWAHAEKWADAGALILVSEYEAPAGWRRAWEKPMPNYLRGDAQKPGQLVEAIFTRETD